MKTFYTERDIEDLFAAGVKEIEVDDNTVITDVAREKVDALGMKLVPVTASNDQTELLLKNLGANMPTPQAAPSSVIPKSGIALTDAEVISRIKAGVIANIGTTEYNNLLDQIIPKVLAHYTGSSKSGHSPQSNSDY